MTFVGTQNLTVLVFASEPKQSYYVCNHKVPQDFGKVKRTT
jgi:hypothetical protein